MRKIIPLISLLFIFSFQISAQEAISIGELQTQIKGFKDSKHYTAGYVESADRSLVYCWLPVRNRRTYNNEAVVGLKVGFAFQGKSLNKTIDTFAVFFTSLGRHWYFLKDEHLTIIADGQKFDIGKNEREKDFKNDFLNGRLTRESIVFFVKRSDIEKIVSAKNVEVKVTNLVYKIKSEETEPIKRLLSMAEVE